jgi:UDP-N-acetylmuramoyl-tripeptide--D-alanyl-D-alanine ligase
MAYICTMIEKLYQVYLRHPRIQTDTRKLIAGEIFFALKGPNFNGNTFAAKALETGAAAVVVDEDTGIEDERIFIFPDALKALQDLALHHRKQLPIPFLAITGSNGKTTTKELIHAVLSAKYKTSTTIGNLNNHIGVPLTILSVPTDTDIAVIEMGANHQKEIESYCRYTLPTHGIITNCGKAHLEGFGGIEGVRKGKGELFDFLRSHDGTAFIMWDYDYFHDMSIGIPHVITYGTKDAEVTGQVLQGEPFLQVRMTGGTSVKHISTQLVGDYNLPNIIVAVAVGEYFNVPAELIVSAIEHYSPTNSRSQLIKKGNNTIILDAYNANPTSMKAAIENFAKLHQQDKYVCIGGMMELGDESVAEHQSIVDLLERFSWKEVLLTGGDFSKVNHHYHYFDNAVLARDWLISASPQNATLLIKGSRSMKMETLLEAFQ